MPLYRGSKRLLMTRRVPTASIPLSIDGSVEGNSAAATTTVSLTTTKSNNIIVAFVETNGGPVTSVTLNGSGMTFRSRSAASGFVIEEWWILAASPLTAASIVATPTSAAFTTVIAFGVNGAKTSAPFDTNGVLPVQTTGNPSDPISVSTTAANTIIFGAFREGTGSPTAGAGFTAISLNADFMLVEYKIVSSPQTALSVTMGAGATFSNGSIGDAIVQGP